MPRGLSPFFILSLLILNKLPQEIVQANEEIRLGADLASKYRKNAQFNIEALRASGALPSNSIDASSDSDDRGGQTPTIDDPQP